MKNTAFANTKLHESRLFAADGRKHKFCLQNYAVIKHKYYKSYMARLCREYPSKASQQLDARPTSRRC